MVSIHAPLKGATGGVDYSTEASPVSIHAPLKGATGKAHTSVLQNWSFNSRTPEGCDNSLLRLDCPRVVVSIHAPLKGATDRRLIC